MNATRQEEALARREIEELLPWHAAGTLSRRDAQRVEEALARDPELASRYELVREELAGTIHLNESLGAPPARAMEKLFAAIEAEPARRQAASLNFGTRISPNSLPVCRRARWPGRPAPQWLQSCCRRDCSPGSC